MKILETAIALSQSLVLQTAITTVIRRIRWLKLEQREADLVVSVLDESAPTSV
jgi:hypothetical protein